MVWLVAVLRISSFVFVEHFALNPSTPCPNVSACWRSKCPVQIRRVCAIAPKKPVVADDAPFEVATDDDEMSYFSKLANED